MVEEGMNAGSMPRLQPGGGQLAGKSSDNVGHYNSVKTSGRYITPWEHIPLSGLWSGLKLICCAKDNRQIPSQQELDELLPIMASDFTTTVPERSMSMTWIGHSTVLIQMDGITILTDPHFSTRASSSQYCCGYKRYRAPPCKISELPHIDLVLISHIHYDHLDHDSVEQLNARFGSDLQWYVPIGTAGLMRSMGCKYVIELDWCGAHIVEGHPNIKVVFTPAQHWSHRGLFDENKALWGSWCVLGPSKRFYFAGDTGYYGPVFQKIGLRYGPFDLAALPIGVYEPREYLAFAHVSPNEAVQIHQDLKARKSLAIHWGTFPSGREFYLDPPNKLKEALRSRNLPEDAFLVLKHGENRII